MVHKLTINVKRCRIWQDDNFRATIYLDLDFPTSIPLSQRPKDNDSLCFVIPSTNETAYNYAKNCLGIPENIISINELEEGSIKGGSNFSKSN